LIELQKWLAHNSHLKGCYPYDAIIKILEDVLADGVITESENKILLDLFNDFTNPTDTKSDGTISLADKIVCLTGEFTYGSKADVAEIIEKIGGEIADGVTSKINILVVGGEGSDNWSFGNYGAKVKKALELNSKGKNIQIIGENAFLEMIKR
jgi:DNA polymerase-3 subunit epsilon